MVHGRSQEGKDPVALKKQWMDALASGMSQANVSLPPNLAVEFPYYGDTLANLEAQLQIPLGMSINTKGPNPDIEQDLRGEIILEMAAGLGITDDDVRKELGGKPVQKAPRNWEWVQAVLRAMDRVPGINSGFIDLATRDVYVYLHYDAVRMAIDDIVSQAIGSDPCVVVAHSLGTVVAYNVLYRRAAAPAIPRLVTVGSPLGINGIKQKLNKPLRHPACVLNWFNAYDERDVVALVALDEKYFGVTPSIENKNDVNNFTENRHGIEGYLSDPVVAKKIVELLK
jgi:hypothetical protein